MARPGRPTVEIILSAEERATLQRWARRHSSSQALALRSKIVLACAEGNRTHAEIARLTARTGAILDGIHDSTPSPDDIIELRRLLYGLHAILELHFAQEEESYLSMAQEHPTPP